MSDYKGDFAANATVRMTFNTFDSDGASVTVTELATTDVFVYKDGTVLADPDAGVTLDLNEGGGNGAHRVSIDLSSDVQYATGADYEVKFEGATVDGQLLYIFVGEFSIQNRYTRGTDSAALATVLGAAVGASISADIAAIPTTMVGTDDAALASVLGSAVGASISADIAAIPTTMVGTDDAALASTLGSAVGASISADIAAIPTTMVGTDNAATSAKQDTMETTLNDVPTTAEFEARTIAAADYLIESDTLARVTLVDTATTVTGGATETKQDAAQTDLDTITDDGVALTAAGVDAILDEEVDNDGTAISLRGAMKLQLSVLTGKSSGGGGSTIVFRDINDSKNVISATVDANGNRTAVGTRDAT